MSNFEKRNLRFFGEKFVRYAISPEMIGIVGAGIFECYTPPNKKKIFTREKVYLKPDQLRYLKTLV